jgi:hypothetical protein
MLRYFPFKLIVVEQWFDATFQLAESGLFNTVLILLRASREKSIVKKPDQLIIVI